MQGITKQGHKFFTDNLIRLWEYFKETDYLISRFSWEANKKAEKKIFTKFVLVLIHLSSMILEFISNEKLLSILTHLDALIHINTSIKLQICSFLHKLHKKIENDSNMASCFQLIASLFCKLVNDGNPIVEQKALEAMINFSQHTVHEELITIIVKKEKNFEHKVVSFLNKKPFKSDNCITLEAYLKSLHNFINKDEEITLSGQTDEFEIDTVDDMFEDDFEDFVPAKIQKLESDVVILDIINNIKQSANSLVEKKSDGYSNEVKTELIGVIEKLQSLIHNT